MLGRLMGCCSLGMSFVFRESSGWHRAAVQGDLSSWDINSLKELHCHCRLGVQPVNTGLSAQQRGALGPEFSSLYFTRNPAVRHFTLARRALAVRGQNQPHPPRAEGAPVSAGFCQSRAAGFSPVPFWLMSRIAPPFPKPCRAIPRWDRWDRFHPLQTPEESRSNIVAC